MLVSVYWQRLTPAASLHGKLEKRVPTSRHKKRYTKRQEALHKKRVAWYSLRRGTSPVVVRQKTKCIDMRQCSGLAEILYLCFFRKITCCVDMLTKLSDWIVETDELCKYHLTRFAVRYSKSYTHAVTDHSDGWQRHVKEEYPRQRNTSLKINVTRFCLRFATKILRAQHVWLRCTLFSNVVMSRACKIFYRWKNST